MNNILAAFLHFIVLSFMVKHPCLSSLNQSLKFFTPHASQGNKLIIAGIDYSLLVNITMLWTTNVLQQVSLLASTHTTQSTKDPRR